MVKLIILENYEKINNFIDQSFLHCLLCRCKIQQNSWKMLLGLSLSPDYGIHLYAEFYADSTFLYRSAGCYDIIGRWYISGDTVILSSPNFNVETRSLQNYLEAEGKIPAKGQRVLLGITKASLIKISRARVRVEKPDAISRSVRYSSSSGWLGGLLERKSSGGSTRPRPMR